MKKSSSDVSAVSFLPCKMVENFLYVQTHCRCELKTAAVGTIRNSLMRADIIIYLFAMLDFKIWLNNLCRRFIYVSGDDIFSSFTVDVINKNMNINRSVY